MSYGKDRRLMIFVCCDQATETTPYRGTDILFGDGSWFLSGMADMIRIGASTNCPAQCRPMI